MQQEKFLSLKESTYPPRDEAIWRLEQRIKALESSEAALKRANRELEGQLQAARCKGCDGRREIARIIEGIPLPLFLKGSDGAYLECNSAFAEIFGVRKEEVRASLPAEFLCEEMSRPDCAGGLQGEADTVSFEARVRRANNEVRVLSVKRRRLPASECFPEVVLGAVHDVTDEAAAREELHLQATMLEEEIAGHQRAEEALRERERMLSLIINTIPQAIFWKDTDSVYLGCNERYARHAGLPSPAEVVGKTDFDLPWPAADATRYRSDDSDVMRLDIPKIHLEEPQLRPDGRQVVLDTTKIPLHDASGSVVGVLCVYEDITEQKKVELELRESEERLRLIFEASLVGIIMTSSDGRIIFGNKRLAEMFGCTMEEMLGTRYEEWLHPASAEEGGTAIRDMMTGKVHSVLCERRYRRKDGSNFYGYLSGRRMVEADGTLRALVGCIADVTEKKEMEEELFKARKLESLGLLAGGIAHDFNNLLTGIMGNISLANSHLAGDDAASRFLARAQQASERSRELAQQLLTFSKGGAPVKKLTCLAQIIRDSATFALMGSNVRCTFDISPDLWPAEIDAGQMSQVISNLVINADQAMPDGGLLVIRAENVLPLDGVGNEKRIRITLKDTGVGISGEHRQRIFDPYFTTKRSGSGLGLATVYSIVKKHDGELKVYSRENHGTTFAITLPAQEGEVQQDAPAALVEPRPYGRILLMDDEEAIRDLAQDTLEFLGYRATVCSDGREALEHYRRAKEEGEPYRAVVMDLTVPGGMGGGEALPHLLEIDPQVVAIASSGYSEDAIMASHGEYGFAGVIAKPYSVKDFEGTLATILNVRGR